MPPPHPTPGLLTGAPPVGSALSTDPTEGDVMPPLEEQVPFGRPLVWIHPGPVEAEQGSPTGLPKAAMVTPWRDGDPSRPALRRHRLRRMPAGAGPRPGATPVLRRPSRKAWSQGRPVKPGAFPGGGRGEPIHPCPGSEVIFPPHWVGEGAPQGTDPAPSQHLGQPSGIPGSPRGPGCV